MTMELKLKEIARDQWIKVEKGQLTVPVPLAILLQVALAGGILVIAFTAPNLLKLLKPLVKKRHYKSLYPSGVKSRLRSLVKQNLVSISYKGDKTIITLTNQGKRKILAYSLDNLKIKTQKEWDSKWRVVVFDIPEKKRTIRNVFRQKLKDLGFAEFQKSVWAHKYPCLEEIAFLVHLYEIRPYVTYFEATLPVLK